MSRLFALTYMVFQLFFFNRAIASELTYQYDLAGRLVSVSVSGSQSISYQYDAAGNLLSQTFGAVVDSDHDEMADDWELLHFKSLNETAEGDFDGDGFTNLKEYLAGTDPTNSKSLLEVSSIDPGNPAGVELKISTVAGRRYVIQSTDGIHGSVWRDRETLMASGEVLTWVDGEVRPGARFYRVAVIP